MSDITINSKVECKDGPCGKSTHLIVEPESGKLTHLVVKDKKLTNSPDRLVPVDVVGDTTGDVIRLNCTREELERMPPYTTVHYVSRSTPDYGSSYIAGRPAANPMPSLPKDTWVEKVQDEHLPQDELDISRDMDVKTGGSKVGKVDGLVVDPDNGEITHLLMRKGHLWGVKDMCVPITAIDSVSGDEVHLRIDKKAIKELPSIPLKPHLG